MPIPARMAAAAITGLAKAITGARSVWLGCNPVPLQRIYFANHSSHSDFVLLWAALPPLLRQRTRPVAGADYWSKGRLRPYVIQQVFNGVLVERHNSSTRAGGQASAATATTAHEHSAPAFADPASSALPPDGPWHTRAPLAHAEPVDAAGLAASPADPPLQVDTLAPLKAALEAGDSLILFPEGTRNMQDALLPFKSGIYHLAKAFPHVEIVPVWLGNLNRVMPKGAVIPLPLLCSVSFGAPLQVHTGESKEGFLARARNALLQLAGAEGETSPAANSRNDPERAAP